MDRALEAKVVRLRAELRRLGSVIVAWSGGVDSSLLAVAAAEELGDRALAVTAVSPSLPASELAACARFAASRRLKWQAVETCELSRPDYAANAGDRCYHCKAELLDVLASLAAERRARIAIGSVVDDLRDHRPGQIAATERGARAPLADCGFTKDDVRAAARMLGLPMWDKPAVACLASRIPYGTPVKAATLAQIEQAEAGVSAVGFPDLRVRHYGTTARIELPIADLQPALDLRTEIIAAVQAAGYEYVTLDLEGLRSGNLNRSLSTSSGGMGE